MVMGASVGEKLVMVCGTPSSRMRKFSFFRLGMMSPCCVVATTSSVTMGTSTAMVTPAWGACCAGLAGLGDSGLCRCCASPPAPQQHHPDSPHPPRQAHLAPQARITHSHPVPIVPLHVTPHTQPRDIHPT